MHTKILNLSMENLITKIAFVAAKYLDSNSVSNEVLLKKNNNSRDVVTELDYLLNENIKKVILEEISNALILSEEDEICNKSNYFKDLTFVIDPLDGSQNFSLGFPFYSSLVAAIENNKIIASAAVSSFNEQMIIWDKVNGLKSNFQNVKSKSISPSYFAYSPIKTSLNDDFIYKIIRNIDKHSSGIYRWGSASNGILELLNGRIQSFIGYEIRIWDCLAFLPILLNAGINSAFYIEGMNMTLIASSDIKHYESLKKTFEKNNIYLKDYSSIEVSIKNE